MAKGKYSNWAKSFGKSVKFGAKDVLTELAPSMAETGGTIAEDVRELRQDLRKLKSNKRQIVNYLLGEEEQFSKYGKEMVKNAKSSLRTGKLYDPNRADKAVMKAMGMDDFDMDFGDTGSFDMNGGSDSDFGDFEPGSTKIVNMTGPSTEAMESVALEIGKTNEAISNGFKRMSVSSKNNFAISEALEKRFHSEKMSQLTAINNNLVSIVQYNNETTSRFVNASLEFYDKNLAVLASINDAMLRLSPVPKETKRTAKLESPVDMFMQGGFSLKGYSQLVAKNARNSFQNSMMGAIFPMMNNEMMLADMSANPWAIPLKWGIESLIPDRFKKSLGSLDKTANSFVPAALAKLGNYKGDNSILQFISEIFGTRTKIANKKFNQNEYERGPIPFDGETKAAITRIIPGYLSRMAATLEVMASVWVDNPDKLESHISEKAIVYNTAKDSTSGGRFMRRSEAVKAQKREKRDTVTRSYSDARWSLRSNISEYDDSGVDRSSEIDNYLIGLTNSEEDVKPGDIEQIKRFILMGETGKSSDKISNSELKSKDLQKKAEAVKFAISKLTNAERLGMAGSERQQARVNLSNYNTFYGSNAEKGVGRHAFISQLEEGSAFSLHKDKDIGSIISNKYRLEKLEDGTYTMPQDKIDKYNKDHGYDKKKGTWLYTAKAIAEDIGSKGGDKPKSRSQSAADNVEKSDQLGLTDRIKQLIHAPFDRMADIMDEANKKLHDIIFGEDGLGGNLEDLILGKKGENGRREGGWFSGAINAVKDTYSETKKYLFGSTDAEGKKVPGLLSNTMSKFSNLMDEYFFGKKEDENGKKRPSITDQIQSTIVRGFGQLASTLFGNKSDAKGREKSLDEAKAAFNKALPDIGKGAGLGAVVGTVSGLGGFGLLGSLFLPGGPIGGALVGGAMGLLSQSKGFREMLFGKETTDKNGNKKRVGGLISDKVQKFFKAKKTAIFGGASMGVMSTAMGHGIAFGLMPSVVVGAFGPVVAGAAWGLLSHSKKFRQMIFGKEIKNPDGTVKKVGGLLNGKMMRSFKVKLPRAIAGAITGIGSMGVVSQLGLVGNMVALGPIPAAIAGAGLGIASASKKFTRAMFGYTDASGKYHSGALDRFKNYMNLEVLEPMKLYAREQIFHAKMWVRKNVFRTISRSIRPFKRVMSDTAKWMQKRFKMVADPITTGFTMVFKTLADKITSILDPVVQLTKKMAQWTMNRFKSAVKMSIMTALLPLRAIGGMMNMLIKGKDYKSSVLDAARGVGNALVSGGGLVGALGTLGKSVFNPDLESDEEKQEKREAAAEKKALLKGDALFAASRAALKERQRQARENGYNLTEAQIAAMKRDSEEQANVEAKIVKNAKESGDPALQMAAKAVEQRAQTNVLLTEIRDGQKAANEADGVNSDDNASAVDEQKKREKAEEKAAEQQEQVAKDIHDMKEGIEGMSDPKKQGEKKKSWLWSLLGGIGSIASGIMSFMGSIGSIGAIALGIYGILKAIFGDKKKGGKSEQLVHSEQAGRAAEYGVKKISRFVGNHPKSLLAIGKVPFELGKAGLGGIKNIGSKIKSIGGAIGDKLTNRIYTKDEFYTQFKDYIKDAKHLDASYNDYLKNPDKFYKRTRIGKAVDFVKAGGIQSKIKSIGGKIFDATEFGRGWNYRGGLGKAGVGTTMGQLGQGFGRMYRNAQKYGWRTATQNAGLLGTSVRKTVFNKEGVGKLVRTDEPWLVKKVRRGIGDAYRIKDAVTDKVGGAVKSIEEKAGSLFGKKIGDGNQTKKLGEGIIGKISKALDSFIGSEACKNLFGKATEKISKFKSAIVDLAKNFADGKVITTLKKLFPKKFAEATTKTATAATGIGLIITAAFTAYDGITGALEADRLFDVAKEDVTLKMRLVSAFVNAFFGLPPMMWIDLILTAASFGALALSDSMIGKALKSAGIDLKNFDHRKIFARYIFELASEETEVGQLDAAQKKYDKAFEDYKKTNKKGDDFSKEQWREETGNKTTWQKYGAPIIDKVLGIGKDTKTTVKSFGERISGWLDDMTKWFKDTVKSITSFSPIAWFKELIGLGKDWSLSKQFNEIGDKLTSWLPENKTGFHPIDTTKKFASGAIDKAKKTASTVKNFFFGNANGPYMNNAKYKNLPFGNSTLGENGCGPMALALLGQGMGIDIDPRQAASMASGFISSGGVRSDYFANAASKLGLGYRENTSGTDLLNAFMTGAPTILGGSSSNPNSPFYGDGHYVVAKGMTANGKVNIMNPTGKNKNGLIDARSLLHDTLGNGGFSGSFVGGGRMSIAEATRGNPKGNVKITTADLKKFNETQKQELEEYRQYLIDNEITAKELSLEDYRRMREREKTAAGAFKSAEQIPTLKARSTEKSSTGFVDEESAAAADKAAGINAKTDGQTETITNADGTKTTKKVKDAGSTSISNKTTDGKSKSGGLGIMDLLSGFTLGLGSLFSSIWGGTKYKSISLSDIKNGIGGSIKSALGLGGGGSGVSGDVQKRLLESAHSFLDKGIYYSQSNPGRLDPDSSGYTDCSGYTAAIYKKAFGKDILTPYGGEFDKPNMAGQWNESESIDESEAQIGDLVFWETADGVPDNHVGMVTDPAKHLAVASNTSTGPAEFQWDNSYWKPMFSGIRRPKALAELNSKYGGGGGGGSFDASEGHINTKKAVWNYLVNDLEMNRAGAAGVMGNIQQESGFNTGAYNPDDVDGNPSGGLVQWHAGRFNNLKNYASSIGKDWSDVESQVGYLGQELSGPYGHVYEKMKDASSVGDAVDTWVRKFEIPADIPGEINKRTPMAEAFYSDHSNFEGGANGFFMPQQSTMGSFQYNNSSGNPLANMLTGGLFNMMNRYNERGRQKKIAELKKMINAGVPEDQIPKNLLKYKKFITAADLTQTAATKTINENAIKAYAETQQQAEVPKPVTATNANIASAKVLPSKVDTGGASMDDLLISIKALDSHRELEQIIGYLSIIAKTGTAGASKPSVDPRTERQLKMQIDKARNDSKAGSPSNGLSPKRYNDLMNTMDGLDGYLNKDMFAVAVDIAKGGNFRTS